MAHPFDVDDLVEGLKTAASDVLRKDVTTLRGFSERQLQAMAKQAAWIAEATAKGEIDAGLRDFFLDNLEDMARNFANTLRGLLAVTIEKVWNALVTTLWKAIEKAAGVTLPLPL
jgi:hypothetical protein